VLDLKFECQKLEEVKVKIIFFFSVHVGLFKYANYQALTGYPILSTQSKSTMTYFVLVSIDKYKLCHISLNYRCPNLRTSPSYQHDLEW
jgi:hypothetical protein